MVGATWCGESGTNISSSGRGAKRALSMHAGGADGFTGNVLSGLSFKRQSLSRGK